MRAALCLLLTAACAVAQNQNRRTKLPYIADAVGNSLPPPSNVPATVGSPANLLTPDRYEFYTFDESGELVKRLMTLEEIQAIVAAGEETDGLVTFANDNEPTIAFNFTQPSQTKVHSVVTNVQNVLKAQMEAHKNKPNLQPTLDTPDVSDSWSLILPSIFGNTGVDIVPDKTSGSFITPETETFEIDNLNEYKNTQSKESNDIPTISTIQQNKDLNKIEIKEPNYFTASTTTTSTYFAPSKDISTTLKMEMNSSTKQPHTNISNKITTSKPRTTSASTTLRTTTPKYMKPTTAVLSSTYSQIANNKLENFAHNHGNKNVYNVTKVNQNISKEPIQYEIISTFSPTSIISQKNESTTVKPIITTKKAVTNENINEKPPIFVVADKSTTSTTSLPVILNKNKEYEKENSTTVTTQSVSQSTTPSLIEFLSTQNYHSQSSNEKVNQTIMIDDKNDYNKENLSTIPMFDVALSISQIASDLGNNFNPIPTSNSLIDSTKTTALAMESKENLEIEIPTELGNVSENITTTSDSPENFVKISTFDPQAQHKASVTTNIPKEVLNITTTSSRPIYMSTVKSATSPSILDAVLSESMGDLLSQVVHNGPDPTSIILFKNSTQSDEITVTTQVPTLITQKISTTKITTEIQKIATTTVSPKLIMDKDNELVKPADNGADAKVTNKTNIVKNENVPSYIIKNNVKVIKIESNNFNNNTQGGNAQILPNSLDNSTNFGTQKKSDLEKKTEIIKNRNVTQNQNLSKKSSSESNAHTVNPSSEPPKFNFNNNVYKTSLGERLPIHNSNKLSNKSNIHKITEEIPKNDDFKKKIQKVNIDDKELANERNNSWKLIPSLSPPKANEDKKDKHKVEGFFTPENNENKNIILEFLKENQGLEVTTKDLGDDILQFTELCNELAFRYWDVMVGKVDKKRSIVFSPYSITSMLAMMFMGAKGATSGEMNDILKLDDMVTFNPHFTLKNISDSIETTSASGVAISAFIRELYSERNKGKLLTFYKERAQHFYNGHVEEINFKLISDVIRRRTNLLVKRYTWGKMTEYLKSNSVTMNPPLAAFSANIFYTDCTGSSVEGRDGEMYFVVSPNVRQRRLVPVPAVIYKSNFLAGYDPVLDATAAALGNTNSVVSTLFLMPGQQGNVVHANDLENLEKRFLDTKLSTMAWNGLLRTLLPRVGLELQIPRFSHKSIFNVSSTLKKMGLKELFDADHADLGGLNGPSKDLYLSDVLQLTTFVTCGEGVIGEQHHIEEYPDALDYLRKRRTSRWITGWDEPRDYQRAFHDPHDVGDAMHLPLHLRPRQARLPARSSQPARLKFDRPFLFFVRHNPSGMILYVGRYNPRLLP